MAEETSGAAAVYVSWTTFKNSIEQLVNGLPNRIDKSVFPGMAGGVQSQFFTGLKFLGLTDDAGKPTPALHGLVVTDEGIRKEALKKLLHERYSEIFSLDLMKTTPSELEERMAESYKVTGSTRDRAVRFFLSAAAYAGIRLSPLLEKSKPDANGGTTSPRRRRGRPRLQPQGEGSESTTATPMQPQGDSRVVALKSGGSLTVSSSLGMFSLIPSDRKFFNDLIEKLEAYEAEKPPDEE